tara:strand:+ start:63 stop:284 length:222 start_codon:yes stop_codon:yes gene_type:complete
MKLDKPLVDYQSTIIQLKAIKKTIDDFLERGRQAIYGDMKQVSPGCWIHKSFKDLPEAIEWLKVNTLPEEEIA